MITVTIDIETTSNGKISVLAVAKKHKATKQEQWVAQVMSGALEAGTEYLMRNSKSSGARLSGGEEVVQFVKQRLEQAGFKWEGTEAEKNTGM